MNAERRYFRVGLFVFLGIGLIGIFAVLLGGGSLFRETVPFETYFQESVQGLEVGSPVKLRGVSIGSVTRIGFVGDHYEFETQQDRLRWQDTVLVRMEVATDPDREETDAQAAWRMRQMFNKGLRLRLTTQGLTGLSYIEADYLDPERFPIEEIGWKPKMLRVPSAPSTFKALSTAAERIFTKLEDVDVERVVENLDTLLVTLNERVEAINTRRMNEEVTGLVRDLRGTNARIQRTLDSGKYDFEVAVENLRVASENLRDLTETAREYPSLLILGQPPKETPGVGAK